MVGSWALFTLVQVTFLDDNFESTRLRRNGRDDHIAGVDQRFSGVWPVLRRCCSTAHVLAGADMEDEADAL